MKKIRLAIIDDDPQVLRALRRDLLSLGHDVLYWTMDGGEFLKLLKDNPRPDLIMTDIRMPDVDGLEIARVVGQLYTEIKVVALTAYSDQSAVRAFKNAGGVGYIVKPWDPPEERLIKPIEIIMAGQTYFQEVADLFDYLPKAAGDE